MGYYDNQKAMKQELSKLIDTKTKGERVPLAPLAMHYGVKYGFGRRCLENALRDFQDTGRINITSTDFEVLE